MSTVTRGDGAEVFDIAGARGRRVAFDHSSPRPPDAGGRRPPDGREPSWVVHVGTTAFFVRRLAGAKEDDAGAAAAAAGGREQDAVVAAMHVRMRLCVDDILEGRWDDARQLADQGIELCEAQGHPALTWPAWYGLAFLAAARGDEHATRALTHTMRQSAGAAIVQAVDSCSHHALALAAVGRGDFDAAYEHAAAASPPGALAYHAPLTLSVALDLVEAAIRTGRHAEAAAHVDALRAAEGEHASCRMALIAGAAAGLAASPDAAAAHFERALATPGSERWPFDLARVRLAYGERLRRTRATSEARAQLCAAHATFQRLRARPWIARAEHELRATGVSVGDADELGAAPLTPQEREIAMLAATGLTNKQIGRRLFLSHRTVGAHLYRIFPKLGITSRAALRDALTSQPAEAVGA